MTFAKEMHKNAQEQWEGGDSGEVVDYLKNKIKEASNRGDFDTQVRVYAKKNISSIYTPESPNKSFYAIETGHKRIERKMKKLGIKTHITFVSNNWCDYFVIDLSW